MVTPRKTQFKDNKPDRKWAKLFMDRHFLKSRKSEVISKSAAMVSLADLTYWHRHCTNYFQDNGYAHILRDPSRVINLDETGMSVTYKDGKVIVDQCQSVSYTQGVGDDKQQYTSLCGIVADGTSITPYILYKYEKMPQRVKDDIKRSKLRHFKTASGWMTEEAFQFYLEHVLWEELDKKGTIFPVIVFVDGHRSHVGRETSELCSRLKIILVALYPNSTHILQPLDVGVFRALKEAWSRYLRQNQNSSFDFKLDSSNFATHYSKVYYEAVTAPVDYSSTVSE
jgi:hypothetical protein